MSRYDSNPFAEDDDVNPFADSRGPRPLPPERYDRGATIDIPLDNPKNLKEKEKKIKAKETELQRREQELRSREAAVGIVNREKNFPAFYPIIHHDISKDIPIHLQKIMYVAFSTYLGFITCLFWSLITVSAYWFYGGAYPIKNWIMSLVTFLLYPPISYFVWYRPLYRAMRNDSALCFAAFFFCYSFHIIYCIYSAIAPPSFWGGASIAGICPAITTLATGMPIVVPIFYFLGFGLFVIETLVCIWILKQVYTYFRGSGKAQSMRRDAVRAAI